MPHALRLSVAAVRTLAAYVAVSLYTLVMAPIGMLLAWLTGRTGILYTLGRIGVRLGMRLTGLRWRASGLEHLPRDRAAVYCMNHASNLEPPIMYDVLRPLHPRLSVLYKAELDRLPVLPRGFHMVGFVPVQRGNRDQSVQAIERAAEALQRGSSFMIFPEGTRSATGELLPFKKGGFVMAIKAQAPVVPVAIAGSREAMQKGSPVIWPVTVSIRIGRPVETHGLGLGDRDALVARVRGEIAAMLAQGPVAQI